MDDCMKEVMAAAKKNKDIVSVQNMMSKNKSVSEIAAQLKISEAQVREYAKTIIK